MEFVSRCALGGISNFEQDQTFPLYPRAALLPLL
jgi:hypothetical protein